jgi:hypothetical protein
MDRMPCKGHLLRRFVFYSAKVPSIDLCPLSGFGLEAAKNDLEVARLINLQFI